MGKEILTSLGYSTLLASNGEDAINVYNSNKDIISLVIMDVVMPEMGGVEAASEILKENKDAKIIFSTGYDKEEMLDAKKIEHFSLISKPYHINQLSQLIRESLAS